MKYTPTPWWHPEGSVSIMKKRDVRKFQVSGSEKICDATGSIKNAGEQIANAAFIVRACNSHEELLEAAKYLVEHLEKMEGGKWLNNRPGELLQKAITNAE